MREAVHLAKQLTGQVTPLKRDCGRVCGARCCSSLEGEETGMLLFPGEEALYRHREGWQLKKTRDGWLVICPGVCDREERPLACRLFPLLPLPETAEGAETAMPAGEAEQVRVTVDERARGVCPLVKNGIQGLDPAFRQAVRQAGEVLLQEEEQRAFLLRLKEEQRELRELRREWGADVYAGAGEP